MVARSYKSAVTRWCHQNDFDNIAWQPRFYDRIIRADSSLNIIITQLNGQKAKRIQQICGCEKKTNKKAHPYQGECF